MKVLERLITAHPVLAYFVLTFAISWGGVLIVIGGISGLQSAPTGERFAYVLLAMLAGPSVSGVLLTAVLEGRAGLRALLARGLKWNVSLRWLGAAAFAAPLLWMATLGALAFVSSSFAPGLFTTTDRTTRVLVGLAVAVGAGLFEEIGWTGFAIPRIRQQRSAFATGVLVGVLWGGWHLLTNVFWASRLSAGDVPLRLFLPISAALALGGYLAAFRVLMVWVYERTSSLLVAVVMHVSLTASVLTLEPVNISGGPLLACGFALAAVVWAAVAGTAAWNRRGVVHRLPLRNLERLAVRHKPS